MSKAIHEFRDPVHIFCRLSTDERRVIDSAPFQRLRNIHQLAMTYLVYPGATHTRFEHSIGVMELAGRVYDNVTKNAIEIVRNTFPELQDQAKLEYWKKVLRVAALCHDIGHLPFSHAAEKELLPAGWSHEVLTALLIVSDEMKPIWDELKIFPKDVIKLALGPKEIPALANVEKKYGDLPDELTPWETILSEIIVGDAFGVDRMDYLLRDAYHLGVSYGRFDHYRLIDTLRILPHQPEGCMDRPDMFSLGIEEGGLQSAEALMLARYFMYSQVYFHDIRRIYDIHLKDYMKTYFDEGQYFTGLAKHIQTTDVEIMGAMRKDLLDSSSKGHEVAGFILNRKHFKQIYERNPSDIEKNPEAGKAIYTALCDKFDKSKLRHDKYTQKGGAPDFAVLMDNGDISSALALSTALKTLPIISIDYIFAARDIALEAKQWINANRAQVISIKEETEVDHG